MSTSTATMITISTLFFMGSAFVTIPPTTTTASPTEVKLFCQYNYCEDSSSANPDLYNIGCPAYNVDPGSATLGTFDCPRKCQEVIEDVAGVTDNPPTDLNLWIRCKSAIAALCNNSNNTYGVSWFETCLRVFNESLYADPTTPDPPTSTVANLTTLEPKASTTPYNNGSPVKPFPLWLSIVLSSIVSFIE